MTPVSGKSEPTYSDRGFAKWPPIADTHTAEVRLYESSSAEREAVWLNVAGEAHLSGVIRQVAGIPYGVAPGGVAAHLGHEQVRALVAQLNDWLRLHPEEEGR